jgi:SPP1 gp7 family putative phage head morphogenesis protein
VPTANEQLLDNSINHEHDLISFERGVVLRMIAVLNRSDSLLMAQLTEALLQIDAGSFTVERLDALLTSVRATNVAAYQAVMDAIEPQLKDVAKAETTAQAAMLRVALPAVVQIRVPLTSVAWEQVYAAAMSRPFQGRLLREWASAIETGRMAQIREAIRSGYVTGQTTADIIRKIRGTKALLFGDGILARPRRELAAVVQTALSHTAQTARQASYDANADLVKAIRWVSTLDQRTSPQCRVRDGLLYSVTEPHKPLGHSVPWGDGPGRLHFNCRSVSVPVLKSWREMGIPIDEITPGTRASIVKQSAARQDEILGKVRGNLLRSGKAKFDTFSNDKGVWLDIEQLMRRINR